MGSAPPTDATAIGTEVRHLLRSVPRGALGTVEVAGGGPYVSLVMVAVDHDASPLLLLSDLADHTRNLKADPRASLLFDGTLDRAVPLAGQRATLQGRLERVGGADRDRTLARYVARHPDAADYAGFGDFNLYRLRGERAHLVGGFGRIHWVDAAEVLYDTSDAQSLAATEAEVVGHMNADHADAVQLYAERLLRRRGTGWCLTGVDPEGADLRRGGEVARLPFDQPAHDAEVARGELVRLVKRARGAEAADSG